MQVNDDQEQLPPSWDHLPTDLLLLIFKYMPASSLAACMFVSRTWKNHVEHVIEVKKKWKDLFDIEKFQTRCDASLSKRQMYYNHILWFSVQKARVKVRQVRRINGIKQIHIYRNHLMAITHKDIEYIDTATLYPKLTILNDNNACVDFHETDYMVAKVYKGDEFFVLHLYQKLDKKMMHITKTNVRTVNYVICYKIHNDQCYVMDYRNVTTVYFIVDGVWEKIDRARFYGNPDLTCAINVFDNQVYLMLRDGLMLGLDKDSGRFYTVMRFSKTDPSLNNDRLLPVLHNAILGINDGLDGIKRKLYLWSFGFDIKAKSLQSIAIDKSNSVPELRSLSLSVTERNICVGLSQPSNIASGVLMNSPNEIQNVSCVIFHGDIMFLGHLDGTIELFSLQDILEDFATAKPLQHFNVKDCNNDITDLAVLFIKIFEEETVQRMFVVTASHVLHLNITHTNCEDYMWSDEVYRKSSLLAR